MSEIPPISRSSQYCQNLLCSENINNAGDFRRFALNAHPDKTDDVQLQQKFTEINTCIDSTNPKSYCQN